VSTIRRNHTGHRVGEGHHRARYSDAVVHRARDLHNQGVGYRAIGKQLGIPFRTVADWCRYDTRWAA